jgi:hypothetical protein
LKEGVVQLTIGRFEKYIKDGIEDDIVELRAFSPPLRDRCLMEDIIREIVAVANTGKEGYILFGVNDAANRMKGREAVPGVKQTCPDDQVEREINNKLGTFTEPRLRIRYFLSAYDGKKIGILIVLRSKSRPHMIAKNGEKLRRGDYPVRSGTTTEVLSPDKLREITQRSTKKCVTVLNFTHTFKDFQREQLETMLDCFVEHIWPDSKIDVDTHSPLGPQVKKLVDDLGYTPEEWQDVGRFVVSLPGLSDVGAVLLAELHGRMGQFPVIVRREKPEGKQLAEYEVEEVIDLSKIRDEARRHGSHVVTLPEAP